MSAVFTESDVMITLYQFEPSLGIRCPSPICLKLETYLRMVELPYQVAANANVLKAPKKKLPYIVDDGKVVADSGFIINYLKATYGDPLDAHLSPQPQGAMLGMRRLIEEHLYWIAFYYRWADDNNWQVIKKVFFETVPMPFRLFVPTLVRRSAMRDLYGQGIGRHSADEVFELGCENIRAISHFLSDRSYLMGDQPTSLDATGYGMLANLISVSIDSRLKDYTLGFENLVAYCDRMHNRYWTNAPIPEPVAI
ncbi:MAG: glutathione S-transferase family protein [Cyanobacteria bacterium J06623_5]